jgi:hypothetical protein
MDCSIVPLVLLPLPLPPPQPLISAAQPSAIAETWNFIACLLMVVFLSAFCCINLLLMSPAWHCAEAQRTTWHACGMRVGMNA